MIKTSAPRALEPAQVRDSGPHLTAVALPVVLIGAGQGAALAAGSVMLAVALVLVLSLIVSTNHQSRRSPDHD